MTTTESTTRPMDDLAAVVARLEAERAILEVLTRYCRAIDRLDLDLLRTVYHEDATDDHGVYCGPVEGFFAFIAAGPSRGFEATQHCLFQTRFHFEGRGGDGDVARTETYFTAYHRRRNTEGALLEETSGARYVDRLERRHGEWRIAHRQVVTDWSRVIPLPPGFFSVGAFGGATPAIFADTTKFSVGERSTGDVSYDLLGLR
jgi:hypothetical protein